MLVKTTTWYRRIFRLWLGNGAAGKGRRISRGAITAVFVFLLLGATSPGQAEPLSPAGDTALFFQILRAPLDSSRMATVQDLTLSLPDIEFRLQDGVIYRMAPIGGKVTGFYYEGKGLAVFTPSDTVEARWLDQVTDGAGGSEVCSFNRLFCRFADWEALSFSRLPAFTPVLHPTGRTRSHRRLEQWMTKCLIPHPDDNGPSDYPPYIEIFRDLKERCRLGSFYAVYGSRESPAGNDRYYRFEPRNTEQITYNGWCHYSAHPVSGIESTGPAFDVNPIWFDIEATINLAGEVRFQVEGRYSVMDSILSYAFLDLTPDLSVLSVTDDDDRQLAFWKGRKECDLPGILVFLGHDHYFGDTLVLRFDYRGKPEITPQGDVYYFPEGRRWYPTTRSFFPAAFDVRFICPDNWSVIASGRKIKEHSGPGRTYSYWVFPEGAADFSFVFGAFLNKEYFFEGIPPVMISAARAPAESLYVDEIFNNVAADILNALSYFRRIFGPYPFENLALIELPADDEAAFPGFVQQPTAIFEARHGDVAEAWRGKGVARQWWGHLVRGRSYHDRWFIAGVANYASALYTQKSRKRDDIFRRALLAWREDILAADSRPIPEPLWRGAGDSPAAWQAKSAWIMHMLRVMMMDLDITTDRRFTAMLRDFLEYYRGREVTSHDFQHQVELYYGEPLDWFFQQWVYTADIPTYMFQHRIKRLPSKQYQVHLRVEQHGVDREFKMPVPVTVTFRNQRAHHQRVWVSGDVTTLTLGPFESKPKQLIFNDFDGVLTGPDRPAARIADIDKSP